MSSFDSIALMEATTLHEQLRAAVFKNDLATIQQQFLSQKQHQSAEYLQSRVDCFFRQRILELVQQSRRDEIGKVILLIFQAFEKGLCIRTTALQCMGDVFDLSNIETCSRYFTIIEENQDAFKKLDQVLMLRICNDLLKRLSRATNASFSGRILFFLSRFLGLSEKSGLNLTGQFNTANETIYEELKAETSETAEEKQNESTRDLLDPNLYSRFWKLQQFFCNPNKCFEKSEWSKFRGDLHEVLNYFASHKLDRGSKGRKRKRDLGNENEPDFYFAKYLTSTKLFDLQIADPQFRRSFLVQCLVILQYLTADVKFKAAKKEANLTEDQQRFVAEIQDKAYRLLRETYPNGSHFSDSIKKILLRESEWSKWKNNGCPNYEAQRILAPLRKFAKRPPFVPDGKLDFGNADLNKLWEGDDESLLAFCQKPHREFTPSLKTFLQDPLDEADPEQQVEEQYKSIYNAGFQWRCSRLLAPQAKEYLSSTTTQKHYDSIPKFLDNVIVKTAHEIPELHEQLENRERTQRDKLLQSLNNRLNQPSKGNTENTSFLTNDQLHDLCKELALKWKELATALGLNAEQQKKLLSTEKAPESCVQILIIQWSEVQNENNADHCVVDLLKFLSANGLLTEQTEAILKDNIEGDTTSSASSQHGSK